MGIQPQFRQLLRNAFCPGEGARDNSCSSSGGGGATSAEGIIRGEIAASVLKLDAKRNQSSREWWNSLAPTERGAVLTLVKQPEGSKRQKQFAELKGKLHDYDKNFTHQGPIDEAFRQVRSRLPTGNQFYQTLLVNAGKAREEVVNGRRFLVAPMTIIVPGVLNGSRGALLYPPSEVAREPGMWNGVPIVRNHPVENGQHVSGRTPSAMASVEMGRVFNDSWDGKRRTAEGWFDVEATKRVDPTIYNRLVRGDKIELSTGLFTDNQDRKGVWNGKRYDAVAYNYRPDHLAILPDQRGACSVEDGCGVMVNAFGSSGSDQFGELRDRAERTYRNSVGPRGISSDLTDKSAAAIKATKKAMGKNGTAEQHAKASAANKAVADAVKSAMADAKAKGNVKLENDLKDLFHAHDNLSSAHGRRESSLKSDSAAGGGGDNCGIGPGGFQPGNTCGGTNNQDDTQSGPEEECECGGSCEECAEKVSPKPIQNAFNPRSQESGKFKRYGSGTGKGPAHWAAQKGALLFSDEDRKLGALAREEKATTGHNPASWVADEDVWEKAKTAADKSYTEGDEAYWPAVTSIYKRMGGTVKTVNAFTANTRSSLMAKQKGKNGREVALDWLTNNVASLKSDQARDTLDELPDEALQDLYVNSFRAAEKTLVCNAVATRWPEINDVVANGGDIEAFLKEKMGGEEEEEDEEYSENKVKNQGAACGEKKGAGDGQLAGDGMKMNQRSDRTSNERQGKKLSFTEMLAQSGDAEAQAVWNHAVEVEREERRKLLQRITANCASGEAKAVWDDLKSLPLPKLRRLANNVAPQVEELPRRGGLFGAHQRIPDYGRDSGIVGNRGRSVDDEPLELPNANVLLTNYKTA